MTILRLVGRSNADTIEALESLLDLARHNELRGTTIYYQENDGHEDAILTGFYKANPAEAVLAALRMTTFLARQKTGRHPPR